MDNHLEEFIEKIKKKKIKIGLIGLGYVGLPLAVEFAKKGFVVFGVETDRDRLRKAKRGENYISDVDSKQLYKLVSSKKLIPCSDFKILKEVEAVIICVPTPLKKKIQPDISFVKNAVINISRNLKKGSLVVLESTTYPGTTEEVILPLLERASFKHGRDFYLCFSPERIDPGRIDFRLTRIPKLIGGITYEAGLLGKKLYEEIIEKVILVSSARVAEISKLLENTFRIVNIAFINEMAMMAHKMGIDIWEVIEAASTKPFGFMPFYPGPGVGGHCIPKDPLYLYWKAKKFGFNSQFIKLSSKINSFMPEYVVKRVEELLKPKDKSSNVLKVLVLGVTYKKDIKDLRNSPALDIIALFKNKGFLVSYYDPLIPYLKIKGLNLKSIDLTAENLKRFDCVIIVTDHSTLNYDFIAENARLIFDTRNVYRGKSNFKEKIKIL